MQLLTTDTWLGFIQRQVMSTTYTVRPNDCEPWPWQIDLLVLEHEAASQSRAANHEDRCSSISQWNCWLEHMLHLLEVPSVTWSLNKMHHWIIQEILSWMSWIHWTWHLLAQDDATMMPPSMETSKMEAGKAGEAEALLSLMQLPSPQDSEASVIWRMWDVTLHLESRIQNYTYMYMICIYGCIHVYFLHRSTFMVYCISTLYWVLDLYQPFQIPCKIHWNLIRLNKSASSTPSILKHPLCFDSTQTHGTQDRSLEAPLGRELLTYQSPRQKRARAWINEFDVPNVKSPERDLGFH